MSEPSPEQPQKGVVMDPKTQAWIDQEDAWLADTIRRHGWAIQYVGGETCRKPGCKCAPTAQAAFAYTIGMFGLAHPELLIVGAGMETSAGVLMIWRSNPRRGEALLPVSSSHSRTGRTGHPRGRAQSWRDSFGRQRLRHQRPAVCSVPAVQLSYDDKKGRFPWRRYASPAHAAQTGHLAA